LYILGTSSDKISLTLDSPFLTIDFHSQTHTSVYSATAMSTSNDQIVSPIDTAKPEFIISAQSINAEPVELDSTPTSPEKVRARRASRDELLAELGEAEKEVCLFAQ
jgi:hypothetical protein